LSKACEKQGCNEHTMSGMQLFVLSDEDAAAGLRNGATRSSLLKSTFCDIGYKQHDLI